jgi:hypothetical protein
MKSFTNVPKLKKNPRGIAPPGAGCTVVALAFG